MTTAELFSRLLSRATVRDPGRVPFDDAVEILAAMNAGISEYYQIAPARFSRTTISTVLPAPATLSVAAVNGSAALGSNAFSAGQRGATVIVGDDAGQNEVVGPASLLDAYMGTSGTVNATVYGDAVVILDSSFKRVVSHPRLSDGTELYVDDSLVNRNFKTSRGIGTPRRYCMEMSGAAGGGKDVAILRVDPMPGKAFIVRMEAELNPLHVVYGDLASPVNVPVPAHMEHALISLIRWHLKGNVFFPDQRDTDEKAQAARISIEGQSPDAGKSHGKVFTPRGW
ncbi:MAG: hypothetical protein WCK57_00655 [Verrucomicrobiae bacterium]